MVGFASHVPHGRPDRARLIAMLAGAAVCVAATSCSSGPPGGVPGAGTRAPPITILTHGGNNGNGDIYISEFSPSGKLLFNAELPAGITTYRAYRLPWTPGV